MGPLLPLAAIAFVLTWLNRSPWWGWALVVGLLVALGATARWWARGHALVQIGAWLLAGSLVWATAVFAHPSPQTRIAGGEAATPTTAKPTTGFAT